MFPEMFNRGGNTHNKCGQLYSMGLKGESTLNSSIHLLPGCRCDVTRSFMFLPLCLPTVMDCTLRLWAQINLSSLK